MANSVCEKINTFLYLSAFSCFSSTLTPTLSEIKDKAAPPHQQRGPFYDCRSHK